MIFRDRHTLNIIIIIQVTGAGRRRPSAAGVRSQQPQSDYREDSDDDQGEEDGYDNDYDGNDVYNKYVT